MPKIKRPARAGSTHDNQLGARTGDEGMWTLDTLPLRDLKRRFGFEPSPKWIEHVRLASVRFNDGGSGAFVSPNGLVLTNHHVALGQLQKVSTAKKDYVRDGFFARKLREEMRCPDLELNVLVSTQDVTKRVLKTVERDASDKKQNEQRKAEMSRIEKESTEATGFRSDVVELYQGGEYWLYRYKKYTDIRLVMAPEVQAAFFGGDPDNFTYPRYALDFAFFRVYENDKPVPIEHYFKWSKTGPKEGELVFVTGHPGSTSRLRTVRQLEHERDLAFPTFLKSLARRRKAYADYAARGPEQARQAQDRLFGIDNGLKAVGGELEGLQDAKLFDRLRGAEDALRRRVAQDKTLAKEHGGAWERIAGVQEKLARRHKEMSFRPLRGSRLADLARTIVRYVVEVQKPNEKRYEEFRDSALESLHHRLFSPAPVYPEMEEHVLADVLAEAAEELGSDDKLVKSALGGKSPQRAAHDLIAGTKLADPKFRKRLIDGGGEAVESSKDP
ncbi:MAG: dipeptidyl-peptidase 7, partial [Phycisphaerales bacterium]|nr:dipeptidyl-peptidase 7 [Phycisphaerales bacterium]